MTEEEILQQTTMKISPLWATTCHVCCHCGSPTKRLFKNKAASLVPTSNNDEDSPKEEDYEEDYDDGPKTCVICGSAPCEWENWDCQFCANSLQSALIRTYYACQRKVLGRSFVPVSPFTIRGVESHVSTYGLECICFLT